MSEAEPGTVREAPPSRSVRSPGRPLFVLAVLYFLASAAIFLANETAGSRSLPVIVLSLATIALYGGLTAILLARKDVDPGQVRVFALLAVLVTATITLTPFPPGTAPPWVFAFFVFMYMLVFLANPAVIVHMAALIPERHQILARRPRFLPAHYVGFLGLGLAAAALLLASLDRPPAQAAAFGRAVVFVNIVAYFYAGTAALLLLGGAARSAATSRGRRQALLVFAGVLPWTAVQALRLVLPAGLEARLPLDALEKAVIFLVPVTMFIAIIGFRMFGLGLLVRRGLIYGLTLGLPFAALGGIWLAAGAFASRALGIEATPLRVGVILLIVGLLLRPVGRRVTAGIDRIFFPEKIALRRLPRAVTGEMAAAADLDGVAGRLVERIRTELQVQSAALLTADEAGRFFRVRALSQESGPPDAAADVVLKSEDLALRPELLKGRPAARLTSSGPAPGEWGAMLARLEAETLVPVSLGGPPTALISLGRPLAGGYFDGHDLDQLEVLAEQVAAVIEHARVRELALIDPLTRLPRRQVALDRLTEELERGRRSGRPPAAALADIDDFKSINDRYGHLTGDRALRAASDALRARARAMDLVARYGGEEILIILPETTAEGALAVCEAMRSAVGETKVGGEGGGSVPLTVSIGVAVAGPQDTVERLIGRADEALYRAKRTGKDKVCLAES